MMAKSTKKVKAKKMQLNKFTNFSICHLIAFLSNYKDEGDTNIIFWDGVKEILELCENNKLR